MAGLRPVASRGSRHGRAGGARDVKKLLALVVAAVGGALAWKKVTADRSAEADLWAEATDRVDPA